MPPQRALLFDLDGTLAITDPLHERAWVEVLAPFGIDADHGYYQRHVAGKLNAQIVAEILPNLTTTAATALANEKDRRFRELAREGLTPVDGLERLLERCARLGWPRALVTNAARLNADQLLQTLKLRFDVSVFGEELAQAKPDPLPYSTAVQLLGIAREQAVAFEDSPAGIRSAVGAGITTVALRTTHHADELIDAGAQLVVDRFDAPPLLDLLFGSA